MMKKILAMLLVVILLPVGSCIAEDTAVGFNVTFSAQSGENAKIQALAELLNILSLEGSYIIYDTGEFDLHAALMLDQQESTRNTLHLYGDQEHWGLESSLFGDESLKIETYTLVEFAYKIDNHMKLPLPDIALLYPGSTALAFREMQNVWNQTMLRSEGTRTVSVSQLKKMINQLSDLAATERPFVFWLKSVSHETMLEAELLQMLGAMDEWLQENVGTGGLQINVKKNTETWGAKSKTFYTRTTTENGEEAAITLAGLPGGFDFSAEQNTSNINGVSNDHFKLILSKEETEILNMELVANNWSRQMPLQENSSLIISISGVMAGLWDGKSVEITAGEADDAGQRMDIILHSDERTEIKASCVLKYMEVPERVSYTMPETTLNTLNDAALNAFVSAVAPTAVRRAIPLVMSAPASFCNMVMDLVTDAGILDALMPSQSVMNEEW